MPEKVHGARAPGELVSRPCWENNVIEHLVTRDRRRDPFERKEHSHVPQGCHLGVPTAEISSENNVVLTASILADAFDQIG